MKIKIKKLIKLRQTESEFAKVLGSFRKHTLIYSHLYCIVY